jgi:hypothetical protein
MTRKPFCKIFTKFVVKTSFMKLRNLSLSLERIRFVLNFTKGIRVTEAGISLPADNDSNEQQAAAAGLIS